jgi:hypothetical protein
MAAPAELTPTTLPAYVKQVAPQLGLDPAAVLAVASAEGIGGGIGDQGTSFGPWQLHYGGALPSSVYQGPNSAATQAWAWSQEGVDYALEGIAAKAHGLTGADAVSAIVTQFERPRDPGPEIQRALVSYPSFSIGQPAQAPPIAPAGGGTATGASLASFNLGGVTSGVEDLAIRLGFMLFGIALVVITLVLLSKAVTGTKIVSGVIADQAEKRSQEARAALGVQQETRRQEAHEAKVKTEKARATELRSRSRARSTAARLGKQEREEIQRKAYIQGAAETAAPNMAAARKKARKAA